MGLDEGIDEAESVRYSLKRVYQLVSLAKQETPDSSYPVDEDDFCDIYFRGGGFLTVNNQKCGRYFRHEIECMDQSFVMLTEIPCEFMTR